MTLSPRKRERLGAFLGELPAAAALKLFAALEGDRARGGKGLPHDAILDDLRRQLVERGSPPMRRPTAKRTFFTPFEDFFVSIRKGKKRRAQIARTSLDPIWRVMMTDAALTETAMAAAALDDAYAAGNDPKQLERTMFLAAEAGLGRLRARAGDNAEFRASLVAELGGDGAFEDLQEVRCMMEGVEALRTLRVVVPSHSPSLDEEQFYDLRQLFLSTYEQSPPLGAYLLLALKGRLEKPWRALGVYYHLAKSADERLVAARETVMALPESLFEDLEGMARALERAGAAPLDAETALARIDYFADYAENLSKQAARAGDNVFVNRVEACRDIAGEAHARFVELALAAMRTAMPVRKTAASTRLAAPRPDFSKALAPETVDEARRAVGLLVAAPGAARRLGADPGLAQEVADEAAAKAKAYAGDLVAEIRAAEGQERAAARHLLDQTLSVIGPLLESDELGLLRDRAAAAAVTA
jgi:hypothetical protein